jgi:hypothetical protein
MGGEREAEPDPQRQLAHSRRASAGAGWRFVGRVAGLGQRRVHPAQRKAGCEFRRPGRTLARWHDRGRSAGREPDPHAWPARLARPARRRGRRRKERQRPPGVRPGVVGAPGRSKRGSEPGSRGPGCANSAPARWDRAACLTRDDGNAPSLRSLRSPRSAPGRCALPARRIRGARTRAYAP